MIGVAVLSRLLSLLRGKVRRTVWLRHARRKSSPHLCLSCRCGEFGTAQNTYCLPRPAGPAHCARRMYSSNWVVMPQSASLPLFLPISYRDRGNLAMRDGQRHALLALGALTALTTGTLLCHHPSQGCRPRMHRCITFLSDSLNGYFGMIVKYHRQASRVPAQDSQSLVWCPWGSDRVHLLKNIEYVFYVISP